MKRPFPQLIILLAFFCCFFFAPAAVQSVSAQKKEEEKSVRKFDEQQMKQIATMAQQADKGGWRKGAGNYFSATKLMILTFLFWGWVATSSWINNDTQRLVDLDRDLWNRISVSVFPGAFIVALFIPIFWAGLPLVVLGWLIPTFLYVHHRNHALLTADKVMTPDHLWFTFRRTLRMNVAPPKHAYETGASIQLFGFGPKGTEAMQKGRGIAARNRPGYNHCRELVYQAICRGATAIRVELSGGHTRFFFYIDGIWQPIESLFYQKNRAGFTSEEAVQMFEAMKVLIGADPQDRQKRQMGEFLAQYEGKRKMEGIVAVYGKSGGEELLIQFQIRTLPFHTLEQLGMSPERAEKTRKLLNAEKGVMILSAMPGQGLRTMTNVAFSVADRFTRDFATVEDVNKPYIPIENIQLNTYDSAKGETPMAVLPDVFFREPKVLLLRDLVNTDTLQLCCEEVENDRLIITSFRGKNSADTIMRLLQTGIDPRLLAESLSAVVTQRLIRRLCPACKEEIPVNPAMLQKLGLPANAAEKLYRKRVRPTLEPGQKDTYVPCGECMEIGYKGRAGLYDIITVNDEIRKVIMTNPSEAAIRQAAQRAGNRTYLTDGAYLVASGTTSFDELVRVLKE